MALQDRAGGQGGEALDGDGAVREVQIVRKRILQQGHVLRDPVQGGENGEGDGHAAGAHGGEIGRSPAIFRFEGEAECESANKTEAHDSANTREHAVSAAFCFTLVHPLPPFESD